MRNEVRGYVRSLKYGSERVTSTVGKSVYACQFVDVDFKQNHMSNVNIVNIYWVAYSGFHGGEGPIHVWLSYAFIKGACHVFRFSYVYGWFFSDPWAGARPKAPCVKRHWLISPCSLYNVNLDSTNSHGNTQSISLKYAIKCEIKSEITNAYSRWQPSNDVDGDYNHDAD